MKHALFLLALCTAAFSAEKPNILIIYADELGYSIAYLPSPVQLYNLDDDLGENKNLATAMPEKVAEMKALFEKLIADGRSTPGALQKNDVAVTRYPSKP